MIRIANGCRGDGLEQIDLGRDGSASHALLTEVDRENERPEVGRQQHFVEFMHL